MRSQQQGFALLEVLLASSVAVLMIFGSLTTLLEYQRLSAGNTQDIVSQKLLKEGLQVIDSLGYNGLASYGPGTYGVNTSSAQWTLSPTPDMTGQYTRTITISTVNSSTYNASVSVNQANVLSSVANISSQVQVRDYDTAVSLCPTQSSQFGMNTSPVYLTNNNDLTGITVTNSGSISCPLVITSITASWTPTTPANVQTSQVYINGGLVYNASTVPNGNPIDITDTTVTTSASYQMIFSNTIRNRTLTLQFTFSDGSTFTSSTIPLISTCSTQASAVTGTISGATLTGGGLVLSGVTVNNNQGVACNVILDRVTVSWTPLSPTRRIGIIVVDGVTVYTSTTGSTSGTSINVTDTPIDRLAEPLSFTFRLGSMTGRSVTILFRFTDGSTYTFPIISL